METFFDQTSIFIGLILILPFLLSSKNTFAQCPSTGCTTSIINADAGTYTINSGEKICLTSTAIFTGTINLNGGTLENCASATQTFTLNTNPSFPKSVVINNESINFPTNHTFQDSITINNFGTMNFNGDLDLYDGTIYNNYDSTYVNGDLDAQYELTNTGYLVIGTALLTNITANIDNSGVINANSMTMNNLWNNSGIITINSSCVLSTSSVGTIDGGCLSCNNWTNRGAINGTSCGTITIQSTSIQVTSGSLTGDIAIVDETPPGSSPFIDSYSGTIGPNIVWTDCIGCPFEICDNGNDDDGDSYIDANDPDCIILGCDCPPGGIMYDTLSSGHTVPVGVIHCLQDDVILSNAWSNLTINGSLYLVNGAHLEITGEADIAATGNLVICESASYFNSFNSPGYLGSIYNFGWTQLCGTVTEVNDLVLGANALTAIKGTAVNINGTIDYVGNTADSSYLFINVSGTLNGFFSGSVCLNGSPEIITEVTNTSVTPTCVTDCDGCSEMSTITTTCNDGSVETAYLALSNLEICNNGIDDDGDGLIDCEDCTDCISSPACSDNDADGLGDACDFDDDNDGIFDFDEGCICENFDLSSLDGSTDAITDFNTASLDIAGSLIEIKSPLVFGGTATLDEFAINDNHETGNVGIQLGVNSSSPSDYLQAAYVFSQPVCNFNTRLLDIDVSDALVVTGFLNNVEVAFTVNTQGVCVAYDAANTFASSCLANSSPAFGNVDDHAINLTFNNCIDSLTFRIYENGVGTGGSFTFIISPNPTCSYLDTDNDGMADCLDLDSDNDGCPDAIEGGATFTSANILNDTLTGGVGSNGLPIIAGLLGQTIGTSRDSLTKDVNCPVEICNNNIDDDGDGNIDYNDDDCDCSASGVTTFDRFDFTNYSVEIGTGRQIDDRIRYTNVTTIGGQSVDIRVTVPSFLINIDSLDEHGTGVLIGGNPDDALVQLPSMNTGVNTFYSAYIFYELFEAGTNTSIAGDFEIEIGDIDLSTDREESIFISQTDLDYYYLSSSTNIAVTSTMSNELKFTGTGEQSIGDSEGTVRLTFLNASTFSITYSSTQVGAGPVSAAGFHLDGNNFSVLGSCVEVCDNGIDDDGNGDTDCTDAECCCAQAPTMTK